MRRATKAALAVSVGVCLSGCAGVTFYSDATLTKQTGIPIYAPKPYLLVARTESTDKPVEVSIVYLNDPQRVIYADPRSGFGSSNLTLALANGQMTAFGQQTDTKIPELINSLSGLLTARATAAKTVAEAAQIRASRIGTLQAAVSTVEAGKKITAVADDMLTRIAANALAGLTDTELQTVRSAAQALKLAGAALSDPANVPSAPQNFEKVKAQTEELSKLPAPSAGTPRDTSLRLVQAWTAELGKIFDSSQPEKEAAPAFELYEIIQGPGAPMLRRVNP